MKRYELQAVQYARRFANAWDYFGVAAGAFMEGFRCSKEGAFDEVEYKAENGEHQLAVSTFIKWKEQRESEPFKTSLQKQLPWYDITDIRVVEKDGVISFQGVAVKK